MDNVNILLASTLRVTKLIGRSLVLHMLICTVVLYLNMRHVVGVIFALERPLRLVLEW